MNYMGVWSNIIIMMCAGLLYPLINTGFYKKQVKYGGEIGARRKQFLIYRVDAVGIVIFPIIIDL